MRWWQGPSSLGRGRRFCEEFCRSVCAAAQAERQDECSIEPVEPLPANRFAWELFKQTFWQWSSNGMGDAKLDGGYVLSLLADRGIDGPERADVMERLRVLAETFQEMLRLTHKTEPATAASDEAPIRD